MIDLMGVRVFVVFCRRARLSAHLLGPHVPELSVCFQMDGAVDVIPGDVPPVQLIVVLLGIALLVRDHAQVRAHGVQ